MDSSSFLIQTLQLIFPWHQWRWIKAYLHIRFLSLILQTSAIKKDRNLSILSDATYGEIFLLAQTQLTHFGQGKNIKSSLTIPAQIAIDFKTGLQNRTCKWALESCCEFDTWSCLSILKLIMTIKLPVIVTKLRRPRINFMKLFFFVTHEKARIFTPGRPFPSQSNVC